MENIIRAWPEVAAYLKGARHILLLTDYDGTLAPITESPEQAEMSDELRTLLFKLARKQGITLGVISGRALSDVKSKVGVSGIIYAGNHGFEIEGPRVSFVNPLAEEMRPVLDLISNVLNKALGLITGVRVENKGLTLSVHYRQVAEHDSGEVKNLFENVVSAARAAGKLRVTPGKKVYEVRPNINWDKGKTIKLLMKKYGKGGRRSGLVPIYLGDDVTDEDGFRVIEKYGNGITVFVGTPSENSAARYNLESQEEVVKLLTLIAELSDVTDPVLRP